MFKQECTSPDSCTRSCTPKCTDYMNIFGDYYFIVVQNLYTFNNKTYCNFEDLLINKHIAVKPGKVSKLSCKALKETLILSWDASKHKERTTHLWYNITITSEFGQQIQVSANTDKMTSITRDITQGIKPYTKYDISIICIPFINNVHKGDWSDPVNITTTTLSSVPGANPEVSKGGFEIIAESSNTATIRLYWKTVPPRDRHGILRFYNICRQPSDCPQGYNSNNNCEKCKKFADPDVITCGKIQLNTSKPYYQVTIQSVNILNETQSVNKALTPVPILIGNKKNRLKTPERFAIRYNETGIFAWWSPVPNADTYTVYWFHGNVQQGCQNSKSWNWQSFPKEPNEVKLDLFGGKNFFQEHSFAISAEQKENTYPERGSSGLKQVKCSYNAQDAIAQPRDFRYDDDINQKPNSLKLEWKAPGCGNTDYIEEYVIIYGKVVTNGKIIDRQEKIISAEKTAYVLQDLEADVTYTISAYSRNAWSKKSPVVNLGQKVVTRSGITKAAKIGIGIGVSVVFVFIIIGIFSLVSRCHRKCKKIREGPRIEIPDEVPKPLALVTQGADSDTEEYENLMTCEEPISSGLILHDQQLLDMETKAFLHQNGYRENLSLLEEDMHTNTSGDSGVSLNNSRHEYMNNIKAADNPHAAAENIKLSIYGDVGASGEVSNESLNKSLMKDINETMIIGGASHEPLHNRPKGLPIRNRPSNPQQQQLEDCTSGESSITSYSKMATGPASDPPISNKVGKSNVYVSPQNDGINVYNTKNQVLPEVTQLNDKFNQQDETAEFQKDRSDSIKTQENDNVEKIGSDHREEKNTSLKEDVKVSMPYHVNSAGYVASINEKNKLKSEPVNPGENNVGETPPVVNLQNTAKVIQNPPSSHTKEDNKGNLYEGSSNQTNVTLNTANNQVSQNVPAKNGYVDMKDNSTHKSSLTEPVKDGEYVDQRTKNGEQLSKEARAEISKNDQQYKENPTSPSINAGYVTQYELSKMH